MHADVAMAAQNEMPEVSAQVEISGSAYDWVTCTHIEESTGIIPSKAYIKIGGGNYDVTGPITLNAYKWPFKHGSRVKITLDSNDSIFLGQLVRRADTGADDAIMWTAWDDKWLLMQIPIRGCLVRDSYDGSVDFLPRFSCHLNPGGFWNCTGAMVGGKLIPVFTSMAEIGKVYESPTECFSDSLTDGKLTAWTPRRFLQYLQFIANLDGSEGILGIDKQSWRGIKNSKRIAWTADSLNIVGKDLSEAFDPLDRKFPDHKFQGKRMLGAIEECLTVAGTHGLVLSYGSDSGGKSQSYVSFYPEKQNTNRQVPVMSIPLVRGGQATDINTGFDFALEESAEKIAESVFQEGAPVLTEIPMTFDSTKAANDIAQVLKPAWTIPADITTIDIINGKTEHEGALAVVFGNNNEGKDGSGNPQATHSWYPDIQNSTDRSCFLYADGQAGRPLATVNSPEALSLMRRCYPRVFRAWYLDTFAAESAGLLYGFDKRYTTAPLTFGGARQILMEQLQYYVIDPTGQDKEANRIKSTFPIRIQVGGTVSTNANWHDVAENSGLRVEADNLIYFDGLVENIDGSNDCLYNSQLQQSVSWPTTPQQAAKTITMKTLRINAACPLDVRVNGYAETPKGQSDLDSALFNDLGGPFEMYIDGHGSGPEYGSYFEKHQVKSQPSPATRYYTGTTPGGATSTNGTTPPATTLTRLVPPGTEAPHAYYAAQRRLAMSQYLERRSSWKMIGIRPEYHLGLWIDKVKVVNGVAGDTDYDLNSPIRTRVLVFTGTHQMTVLGGLVSQLTHQIITGEGKRSTVPTESAKSYAPQSIDARDKNYDSRAGKDQRPGSMAENGPVTRGASSFDTD